MAFRICSPERDCERKQNPGEGRMDPRFQHRDPHHDPDQNIRRCARDAPQVQERADGESADTDRQRRHRQVLGIEYRDDHDRTEIVDDRDCGKKYLDRQRHAAAEQHQDTEREGDVRRGGNRPAVDIDRVRPVEIGVNCRGYGHAADGGDARQGNLVDRRKLAFEGFAFDFEADQEKEDGHQPVIDP